MLALVAVLIGGAIGTGLRLGLDDLFVVPNGTFPASTLVINVVGSLALGFLVARVWPTAPAWTRAGLGPGVLGGFTTFSAVMVSMVTLAASGRVFLALVYIMVTLVLGLAAAVLGIFVGRRRGTIPGIEGDE
ncbi:MAG: CrcB family protein [Glaciihabitans sp.]|jgi:CrcB protein|nr:CrcB family protein [Glaciihabitans sp.]